MTILGLARVRITPDVPQFEARVLPASSKPDNAFPISQDSNCRSLFASAWGSIVSTLLIPKTVTKLRQLESTAHGGGTGVFEGILRYITVVPCYEKLSQSPSPDTLHFCIVSKQEDNTANMSAPERKDNIYAHWKCLAACTLVSMCPFQYGTDFGIIGGLQAMKGFLEVCHPTGEDPYSGG